MTVLFDGELFADYNQFYIADVSKPEIPTNWSTQAIRNGVLCGAGVLTIVTARNMPVPVRIELHEQEPAIGLEDADHVVLASLSTDGEIVMAGCSDYTPDAARALVPAGNLRALVIMKGLGTLSEDGLEGADSYTVHLWPGSAEDISVIRQWESSSHP